jgi:hypothetical protein
MLTTTTPSASPFRRVPLWVLFAGMTVIAVQCALGMPGDAIVFMSFAAYGFIAGWMYDVRNSDSLFENGQEVSYHVFARPMKIIASFSFLFPILFRVYYIISGTPFVNPTVPDGPVLFALFVPSEASTWLFFSGDRREPMVADLLGGYLIGCTITAAVGCMIGFCWGNFRRFVLPIRSSDKELPSSS